MSLRNTPEALQRKRSFTLLLLGTVPSGHVHGKLLNGYTRNCIIIFSSFPGSQRLKMLVPGKSHESKNRCKGAKELHAKGPYMYTHICACCNIHVHSNPVITNHLRVAKIHYK